LEILLARFRRIPPHKRPRYAGVERSQILAFKSRYRLSNRKLATWFMLDPTTFSAWNLDVDHPERRTTPLVEPVPDVRTAIGAVARYLPPVAERMKNIVADALATLAHTVNVRRRRPKRNRARADGAAAVTTERKLGPLEAESPNHIWGSDITVITLGSDFYLLAIIDVFSRDILAWELFSTPPKTHQVLALFD
jgi:hypothetical protein